MHAHHDPDKTNGMQNRTFPGIYLGPTGNMQGTVKVLDLNTGRVKKPKTFTEVPMPASVVKLVNDWGKKYQKQKEKNRLNLRTETEKNTHEIMTNMRITRWSSKMTTHTQEHQLNSQG